MSVTIAGLIFDHHHYDDRGDVLYVSVSGHDGPPARAVATTEGHGIEYDSDGRVVGMTLTNVRWALEWRIDPWRPAFRAPRGSRRGPIRGSI